MPCSLPSLNGVFDEPRGQWPRLSGVQISAPRGAKADRVGLGCHGAILIREPPAGGRRTPFGPPCAGCHLPTPVAVGCSLEIAAHPFAAGGHGGSHTAVGGRRWKRCRKVKSSNQGRRSKKRAIARVCRTNVPTAGAIHSYHRTRRATRFRWRLRSRGANRRASRRSRPADPTRRDRPRRNLS
jgi:hypothetical protein